MKYLKRGAELAGYICLIVAAFMWTQVAGIAMLGFVLLNYGLPDSQRNGDS